MGGVFMFGDSLHLCEIFVRLCEHFYVTILYSLLTLFKEREIEKFIQPEEPEPEPESEPEPEETPVPGIQLTGCKSSLVHSSS